MSGRKRHVNKSVANALAKVRAKKAAKRKMVDDVYKRNSQLEKHNRLIDNINRRHGDW